MILDINIINSNKFYFYLYMIYEITISMQKIGMDFLFNRFCFYFSEQAMLLKYLFL